MPKTVRPFKTTCSFVLDASLPGHGPQYLISVPVVGSEPQVPALADVKVQAVCRVEELGVYQISADQKVIEFPCLP